MKRNRIGSRCNAATTMVVDNDDLLMDLLVHLSVKDLLRYRAVNKRWKALISSSCFHALHCNNHRTRKQKQQPCLLITTDASTLFCVSLDSLQVRRLTLDYPLVRVIQACVGLVLLGCQQSIYERKAFMVYMVYNPSTGMSRVLPITQTLASVCGLCLVHDPSKSLFYEVVCVWSDHPDYRIEIFDSKTGNWTDINQKFVSSTRLKFWHGVYCNNGIYWINTTPRCFHLDLISRSFRKLGRIRLPTYMGEIPMNRRLISCNDHMFLFGLVYTGECFVYEFKEGNLCWINKYSFDHPSRSSYRMRGSIGGEMKEMWIVFFFKDSKLYIEKLSDSAVIKLEVDWIRDEGTGVSLPYQSYCQFFDSFAPV